MLVASFVLSAAICLLLGGRLSRAVELPLVWLWLPVLSLVLRAVHANLPPHALPAFFSPALLLTSYGLLFAFLWRNRRPAAASALLALGSACNLLVIAANGFRMPVTRAALDRLSPAGAQALAEGHIPLYALADEGTRFLYLGDVFWFPLPFFQGFASLGDCALALGVFLYLVAATAPPVLCPKEGRRAKIPR